MSILENKLVIKSIEALHDEALALVPDTTGYRSVTSAPAVLDASNPPQKSPINLPKSTSADASPETGGEQDIMDRIDHLLRKLDEDGDVAIAPQEKEPQPNTEDKISEAIDSTTDGNSDDMFNDGQKDEKPRPEQSKALADIAEAIYQAQHQAVDTVAVDANQNNSTPFDVDVLSATVADEVCRTVSAVMIAELPHLVRDAVGKEIRALPADKLGQSEPAIGNQSATRTVAARKTAANRKSKVKKVGTKKTATKKASVKTGPKKSSGKKLKPKKVVTKTTAKITPST